MKQENTTHTFVFAFAGWNSSNPLSYQLQYLAQKLAEIGNQIIVIVQEPGTTDEYLSEKNISVLSWPSKRPTKLKDAWLLAKVIKKYKPVCVLANFAAVNWMMIVGKLFRVPVRLAWYQTLHKQIITDRNITALEDNFLVRRKKLIYKLATHVIPVSNAGFEEVESVYRVQQEKCKVIYNLLLDPINFVTQKTAISNKSITCIARLDNSKGHDVLLHAIHLLHNKFPDIRVRLIGDGIRKPHLISLAHSLGIADNIVFVGQIPHDDVLRLLSTSCIMVNPTRIDNCPFAVIESIAVGTPVVGSSVGGVPEIVRDGVDGFLVPPDSPEALANAIEKKSSFSRVARNSF